MAEPAQLNQTEIDELMAQLAMGELDTVAFDAMNSQLSLVDLQLAKALTSALQRYHASVVHKADYSTMKAARLELHYYAHKNFCARKFAGVDGWKRWLQRHVRWDVPQNKYIYER